MTLLKTGLVFLGRQFVTAATTAYTAAAGMAAAMGPVGLAIAGIFAAIGVYIYWKHKQTGSIGSSCPTGIRVTPRRNTVA